MYDSLPIYTLSRISDLTNGIINLTLFLPYYFSVQRLFKTLVAPWKLTGVSDPSKQSISEFFSHLSENFASRLVGFMVRSSILFSYLVIQAIFVIIIPFLYIFMVGMIPLRYIFYRIAPSEAELRDQMFQEFMKRHLADQKNQQKVVEWFEMYYQNSLVKPWWSLERLLKQPPLGRDLTFGYTPTLDTFAIDLTVQKPHFNHLIGRKAETEQMQQILIQEHSPNVLLSGELGVGKGAIVEALAQSIYQGGVHSLLAYKRVLEVNFEKILSHAQDFIGREAIVSKLLDEGVSAGNIIVYIPDIERYIDNVDGHIDLSKVFARYATSPRIQFIASTTPSQYQKYVFPVKEVVQVFEKIDILEITPAQTRLILLDCAPVRELKSGITITYEAIEEIVHLSQTYSSTVPQPEASLNLLDQAISYAQSHSEFKAIDGHVVRTLIEQQTHIPTELTPQLREKIRTLDEKLRERVLFQDEALHALSSAIRKAWLSLSERRKPLATMLFLGPTGVGKTETAKAVTDVFFDVPDALLRFDMANYQSQDDIAKLIGSSITHEPGELTEAVRKKPYGTLLLDELEKAHPQLLNIFLTLLDEGYFIDGYGDRVDCTHLIVIATSNAGADFIFQRMSQGETDRDTTQPLIDHLITNHIYTPEFLNRFDGVVVFKPLYKHDISKIAEKMLQEISRSTFEKHKATVSFSPQFIASLIDTNYDPRFGARNMRRIIQNSVEDSLAKMILEGSIEGKTIQF